MRQALRPITPRACVAGAESAIFEIYFSLEKKDLLLRSGLEPGSDALQTTAEPMGLSILIILFGQVNPQRT